VTPDSNYAFISVERVETDPGTVVIIDLQSLKTAATIDVPQQAAGIDYWKTEASPLSTTGLARSTYGFRGIAPKSSRAQSQFAANPGEEEEMSAKLPDAGENGFRLVA
jgi:hypothetical protein